MKLATPIPTLLGALAVSILGLPRLASADPDASSVSMVASSGPAVATSNGYLGGGVDTAGALVFGHSRSSVFVDGAVRIGDSPLLLQLQLGRGTDVHHDFCFGECDSPADLAYTEVRAGLLAETCTDTTSLCFFAGAEVSSLMYDSDHERVDQIIPAAGIDVGGDSIRFRVTVDARKVEDDRGGLALGLGHRF